MACAGLGSARVWMARGPEARKLGCELAERTRASFADGERGAPSLLPSVHLCNAPLGRRVFAGTGRSCAACERSAACRGRRVFCTARKFAKIAPDITQNPTLGMGRRPKKHSLAPSRRKTLRKSTGQRVAAFSAGAADRLGPLSKVGFHANCAPFFVKNLRRARFIAASRGEATAVTVAPFVQQRRSSPSRLASGGQPLVCPAPGGQTQVGRVPCRVVWWDAPFVR